MLNHWSIRSIKTQFYPPLKLFLANARAKSNGHALYHTTSQRTKLIDSLDLLKPQEQQQLNMCHKEEIIHICKYLAAINSYKVIKKFKTI